MLHDVLRDAGYEINFILSGSHSWNGLRKLYGDSIDLYADGTSFEDHTLNDDRGVVARLERHAPFSGRPTFFYFHLMTTHMLGRAALPSQDRGWSTLKDQDRYHRSVEITDRIIERLFELLEAKGYLGNSLVVITGDHGEGFGEHGNFGHLFTLFEDVLRVPLLLYDPEGPSLRATAHVTQLDVAPTILDLLRLPIPSSWQGRSLLGEPPAQRLTIHQTVGRSPRFAVCYSKDGRLYKLITGHVAHGRHADGSKLFELSRDPLEQENMLRNAPPELLTELLTPLAQYQRTLTPIGVARAN